MDENIVFVLGAGFSKAAGLPTQKELLPGSLAFKGGDYHFKNAKSTVQAFISENFSGVKLDHLALEDLFTILDKAVLGKEYFSGYPWQTLYLIRKSLVHILLVLIDTRMQSVIDRKKLYKGLGRFITGCILKGNPHVSIISLNWDTLFESVINDLVSGRKRKRIDIDYCVFSHLLPTPHQSSGPVTISKYALKIMKLHGSINWLYCPNCSRLYVHRYKNIGIDYADVCPHCPVNEDQKILLEEMILTPTMLKELQNHHLGLTWQHAFMELNRADKVVFIGYSLPLADFELRYFFKKALPKDAELYAVLHAADKTNGTRERYENFFGMNVQFCFDGFENWWKECPFNLK
jgi:NAD-dependent SIR2 family protein deacetylase